MELCRVVTMRGYKAQRLERSRRASERGTQLPEANQLWELLDKNISIEIWKKGI